MLDNKLVSVLESVEMKLTLTMSNSLPFSFHEHDLETSINLLKSTKLETIQKEHKIHYMQTRVKLLVEYRREQQEAGEGERDPGAFSRA
jgi:hypothetical protein